MSKHRLTVTMEQPSDCGAFEVTLEITFNVTPGRPETPPSYAHGGLPAEATEVEFTSAKLVECDVMTPTQAQIDAWAQDYLCSDRGEIEALEVAGRDWADAKAYAEELRAEERRERFYD